MKHLTGWMGGCGVDYFPNSGRRNAAVHTKTMPSAMYKLAPHPVPGEESSVDKRTPGGHFSCPPPPLANVLALHCTFSRSLPSFVPWIQAHIAVIPSPPHSLQNGCVPPFVSREGFSIFSPRRLSSNCAHTRYTLLVYDVLVYLYTYIGEFLASIFPTSSSPSGELELAKSIPLVLLIGRTTTYKYIHTAIYSSSLATGAPDVLTCCAPFFLANKRKFVSGMHVPYVVLQ